jgi:predicted outer membrane protein
MERES